MRYLLLYLLTSISLFASVITGRVIAVTDGDTITVLDDSKTQHKIRLWGIDAPESRQDYGQRAKEALFDMVYYKDVMVDVQGIDRYGREIGKVYHGEMYVNMKMINKGLAWWYKQYAKEATDLRDAEAMARAEKIGLWSRPDVVAPWDFRRGKRDTIKSKAAKDVLLSSGSRHAYKEPPDLFPAIFICGFSFALSVVFLILAIRRKRRNAKSSYGVWLFLSRFFCVATVMCINTVLELCGVRLGALPLIAGCVAAMFVPAFFARIYSNKRNFEHGNDAVASDSTQSAKTRSIGIVLLKLSAMLVLSVFAVFLSKRALGEADSLVFGVCVGAPSYYVIRFVCDTIRKSALEYRNDNPQKALSYGMLGVLVVLIWIAMVSVLFHVL